MKTCKWLFIVILSIIIQNGSAQYMSSHRLSGVGLPFFRTSIFRTFSEDGKQRMVRIYVQMVNDDITFIKADDHFTSEIQIEIYIKSTQDDFVFNRTLTKRVECRKFSETNSRQIKNTFTTDIPLEPSEYEAIITVLDKNSNKQVNRKIHFKIEDFDTYHFLVSDVMFFKKYERDSTGRIVDFEPSLNSNFATSGKYIYFYFASVVADSMDTLKIYYTIRDASGGLHQHNNYFIVNDHPYQEHYIRINRQQFDQSRYLLEVIGQYGDHSIQIKQPFSFYWTVLPESPRDLEKALEQMRYLPEADSVDWALKQPYEEKLAYFKRFWKRMDPNPETEKNELMDEYYRRVNYANENFSTPTIEGWETDRGRIFIKFGEPDDIERHPFEIDTYPYEIWRYYNLRKVFVFVDRTGFGDYYLHPAYLDEEYR